MISIVIPLYNKEKEIGHTLDSICAQSYKDYEVVVVDDGSTDDSAKVVERYAVSQPKIRLLRQDNAGVSAARNRGIKEALSDYVALCDADDLWDENCLAELHKMTIDFPDAGMCGVNYADIVNRQIIPYSQGVPEGYRDYVINYFSTSHGDLFCSSSVILRKNIAISSQLFDERIRISEDMDFWYRIILHHPVAFYNKVLSYYNKDANNRAEKVFNAHYEITHCMEYYIDKYSADFNRDNAFARFISMRATERILYGHYYFGNKHDRDCSNHIVKHLSFSNLPYKYTLIFKTPRFIGWVVFQLSCLKKRLSNGFHQDSHYS